MAESVRTFWRGYLRLALVAIPVRLVSAEKAAATPRFHQIDRKSKQRIRYIKSVVAKGAAPKAVPKEDIVMGYEIEPGNFVLMEPDELDAVKLETRHTIELTQFVEMCEIDPLYFERPYYILPDGDVAEEGYVVIRDALKASRKAAIGQLTLRGRENLVALYPGGKGLVLDTLRYEEEVKDADSVFSDLGRIKPRADMLKMAEELIRSRAAPFDPAQYKNHYAEALRDLVKQKLSSGGSIPVEDEREPGGGKVIDFMEALKRSLKGDGEAPKTAPARAPKRGTAAAKAATKAKAKPAPKKKRA
ncbi:MAG TPA: Ku protein [Rhodoblastus sp.]|nr:Ku protein [Rhodoblastus sp.]